MIILRQKEFGNKANKIKTRQWQMTQAVNPVIQHQSMGGIPQEQILKNSERYKKAIEINKVLPSSEYDNPSISKVDKRLGNLSKLYYNRQEDMDKILKIEVLKNKRNEGTGKN